jgi:hypothetical protein
VAFGPDIWMPSEVTITANKVLNAQGKVTGWKLSGDVNTVRYNLSTCGDGSTYDRYAITHYTGASVTSVQVNGKNMPLTPAV